jgi:Flp pilus assembly pilin Flp
MKKTILIKNSLTRFQQDESGEHATEVAMLLAFVVLPLIYTVFLLQDILKEYVAYGQIFISSPFF